MAGNYKDLTEEENIFWNKVGKLDPLLFSRGYSAEEINRILKENGIIGDKELKKDD